jgi:hypothetical protein
MKKTNSEGSGNFKAKKMIPCARNRRNCDTCERNGTNECDKSHDILHGLNPNSLLAKSFKIAKCGQDCSNCEKNKD